MKKMISYLLALALILSCFSGSMCEAAVVKTPKLNVRSLCITRDASYKLRVYNTKENYTVSFESDNTDVVSVRKVQGASCKLRPKSSGAATVTAEVYDENEELVTSLKCVVTVSPPAVSVKFNKRRYKILEGKSKKIKAIIKPNISNEQPLYISDDPSIATVSSTGTITAIAPGQTTIRAIIASGKESSYILKVTSDEQILPNENFTDKSNTSNNTPSATPAPDEDATPAANPHMTKRSNKSDYDKQEMQLDDTDIVEPCDE